MKAVTSIKLNIRLMSLMAAFLISFTSCEDINWTDVHGAGAQRSDPKTGDPAEYSEGHGPRGDAIRIYNYVRQVRNAQ